MTRTHASRWGLALPLALLLSACATAPIPVGDAQSQQRFDLRKDALSQHKDWTLQARLSVDDGEDGGSGSLRWNRQGAQQTMNFHGALGRGAWQLKAGPGSARLERADGSEILAGSVEELVRRQLGQEIPVNALSYWARGLPAPGDVTRLTMDEQGQPETLEQLGWFIEFDRYRDMNGFQLPVKIEARRAELTVKLAVRSWSFDVPSVQESVSEP